MAKSKKDEWLDDYVQQAQTAGVTAGADAVLYEKPEGIEKKAVDAELERAVTAAIPQTRNRVSRARQAVPSPSRPRKPEFRIPAKLRTFSEVMKEDRHLNWDVRQLIMIIGLLRISWRPGDINIRSMGFDQANLHELMQAVFSRMHGEVLDEGDINSYISDDAERLPVSVIYEDLLGLDDSENSTKELMKERGAILTNIMKRLSGLRAYASRKFVNKALLECRKHQDLQEKQKIITEDFHFDSTLPPFDVKPIKDMLKEVEREVIAKMPHDVVRANPPAMASLCRLHQVFRADPAEFQAKYQDIFNVADAGGILAELGDQYPEPQLLWSKLAEAAIKSEHVSSMIAVIMEEFEIEDRAQLDRKLEEVHQMIVDQYQNMLSPTEAESEPVNEPIAEPAPTAKPAVAAAEQSTFDAKKFYDEVLKSSAEAMTAYYPLYHLYFALKDDDKYDARDKDAVFAGKELATVMADVDRIMGVPGLAVKLQAAAKANSDYKTALIEVIAQFFDGLSEDPKALLRTLVYLRDYFCQASLYPQTRQA